MVVQAGNAHQSIPNLEISLAIRADANRAHFIDNTRGNGDIAGFLHGRSGIQRTDIPNDAFFANWGAYWDVPVGKGTSPA